MTNNMIDTLINFGFSFYPCFNGIRVGTLSKKYHKQYIKTFLSLF